MTTRITQINNNIDRYVKKMMRDIKVKGVLPYTITSDGVVLEARYGGLVFETEHLAMCHVAKQLFYPKLASGG